MTEKKIYIGSTGPFLFDDTDPVEDIDGDFSGEMYHGLITNGQLLVTEAPTSDDEVLRLGDANNRVLDPLAVADINDPSTELGAKTGTVGTLILVYQVKVTKDEITLYEWDSANSGGVDIPYVVAGSSGFWNAIAGKYSIGINIASHDDITATSEGVAASIATETTFVTTNGDSDLDNITLANGIEGQVKYITCIAEGNAADTWKITPANMIGGAQITFAGIGEGCILKMYSAGWIVVGNNGGTIS